MNEYGELLNKVEEEEPYSNIINECPDFPNGDGGQMGGPSERATKLGAGQARGGRERG